MVQEVAATRFNMIARTNFAFVLVNSVENIPTSFGTLITMIMVCKISN